MTGKSLMVVFWLVPAAVTLVLALIEAPQAVARKRRAKREKVFVELRQHGYDICDINTNATRAKLRAMDPYHETPLLVWHDIVDIGDHHELGRPMDKSN